ncbi:MAG: hypothetical protein R3325_04645, partial [Thermoanaerobaculia bacterium]|nr:hypothetical protein [Thermoanaerobaculia bacterium]
GEHLPAALDPVPELVYYLAGTDPAHDDRLGNWQISDAGMLERDVRVVEAVRQRLGRRAPLVVVLAGGYGGDTWRHSARFFAWLLSGRRDLPVPTTNQATLARLREIARYVEPPGKTDEEGWGLTEEDVYGSLGEVSRRTRLLDYFSPHGVELILERSGLFDQLRSLGFAHPTPVFELDNPAGQTLRVFGDADRRELLIEARLARDRATLPDFELLLLQWLVSQNPRAEFHPERPPLPGQSHPGLGLLRDLMALLVLLAERLKLDGILFVPSHYHLAAKGKRYLRFADPADEGWFLAVAGAVSGLDLGEASRAVRDGRVVAEGSGEPVAWRPMPMVIPLSRRLERHLESAAYEERVEAERRAHRFRLEPEA